MLEMLRLLDLISFSLAFTFLILAVLIRRKIKLPQNNVLMAVGFILVVLLGVHVPEYFPSVFPEIGEDLEHIIQDLALFATVLVLLWYGATTYIYLKQVVPSHK